MKFSLIIKAKATFINEVYACNEECNINVTVYIVITISWSLVQVFNSWHVYAATLGIYLYV